MPPTRGIAGMVLMISVMGWWARQYTTPVPARYPIAAAARALMATVQGRRSACSYTARHRSCSTGSPAAQHLSDWWIGRYDRQGTTRTQNPPTRGTSVVYMKNVQAHCCALSNH